MPKLWQCARLARLTILPEHIDSAILEADHAFRVLKVARPRRYEQEWTKIWLSLQMSHSGKFLHDHHRRLAWVITLLLLVTNTESIPRTPTRPRVRAQAKKYLIKSDCGMSSTLSSLQAQLFLGPPSVYVCILAASASSHEPTTLTAI